MSAAETDSIINAIRDLRRFTEDVGKLLATARDILKISGWQSTTTQAISISTSLNLPHNWIAQDAFWFVFNPQFPKHLAVISVIFDNIEAPAHLKVPVVAAGYVFFSEPVGKRWSFKWARLNDVTDGAADGVFRDIPVATLGNPEDFHRAEVAAWPLRSITNAELVEQQVVAPLLTRIGAG